MTSKFEEDLGKDNIKSRLLDPSLDSDNVFNQLDHDCVERVDYSIAVDAQHCEDDKCSYKYLPTLPLPCSDDLFSRDPNLNDQLESIESVKNNNSNLINSARQLVNAQHYQDQYPVHNSNVVFKDWKPKNESANVSSSNCLKDDEANQNEKTNLEKQIYKEYTI